MTRKEYFAEPTVSRIVKDSSPVYLSDPRDIVRAINSLNHDHHLVIEAGLTPPRFDSARKFLKHGHFVQVKSPKSVDEAVEANMYPWMMRREAFDLVDSIYFAGYSFRPFGNHQDDQRERRVRLVECLEAERIVAYGYQTGNDTEVVKIYDNASRISKDGARARVSVPSRTNKMPRYKFYLDSIVLDSSDPNKFAITNGFLSTLSMPAKEHDWRHNYYTDKEDSRTFNIFAHEIAAYYKIMLELYHGKIPNLSPLEMSPFPLPAKLAREFYKKLLSKVVIKEKSSSKNGKLRRLNKAEQEILVWALVKQFGYMATMYSLKSIDGKVQEANWSLLWRK